MRRFILCLCILVPAVMAAWGEKKIDVYGYSDFTFSYWKQFGSTKFALSQNRTNILLSSQFFKRWDFFVNIEFKGSYKLTYSDGSKDRWPGEETFAPPFEAGGEVQGEWQDDTSGRVELEEAWVRYALSEKFEIRLGSFHAPFGVFNTIQEASPTYITVRPPMIYDRDIRESIPVSIIPDKTNIEVTGLFRGGKLAFRYHLYLGNGLGSHLREYSLDSGFAVGGRVQLNYDENITLGFSTYFDEAVYDPGFIERFFDPENAEAIEGRIHEKRALYAVDIDWTLGPVNLNGEYILNKNNNDLLGKFDRKFYYINLNVAVLPKVRLYGQWDHYLDKSTEKQLRAFMGNGLDKYIFGINYKPNWVTAIKAEVQRYNFSHSFMEPYTRFVAGLSVIF